MEKSIRLLYLLHLLW